MRSDRFAVGVALLLVTVLSWGATFPVGKSAVSGLDPYWLGAIRYVFTASFFAAALALAEGPRAFDYDGRFAVAATIGVIGFCGFNLLAFIALQYTRAEHVALVNALQAPMTALAHWLWRGVRPARFTFACMAAAFVGVALVVTRGDPAAALQGGSLVGAALALGAAISWVAYVLGVVKLSGFSALRYTTLTCIPGTVGLALITLAATAAGVAHPPAMADLHQFRWEVAYLIVFTGIVGVLCWNAGIHRVGPLNAVLLANLIPIVVFAIAALQGTRFAPVEVGGAALVIGALVANNLYLRRAARK